MKKHPQHASSTANSTARIHDVRYCEPVSADVFARTHGYADILGVKMSAVDMGHAVYMANHWIATKQAGYVCVTGVHGVMEAQRDSKLKETLNHAVMNIPDGMPMSWIGRLQGFKDMDRVFGPDFMFAMCRLSLNHEYRHFLYGGQPGVAAELEKVLTAKIPGLQIVGTYTPPFRSLNTKEEDALLAQVHASRPHIFWVGLSTPKQEYFMAQYVDKLQVPLLVGVGAAFDYHTGRIKDCSPWIKRAGLQWMHRLLQDPGRLWRRYLRNNSAFVWNIALQFLKRGSGRAFRDATR